MHIKLIHDVKTKVTGKSGLTASLFCCLGVEDKNLRVSLGYLGTWGNRGNWDRYLEY